MTHTKEEPLTTQTPNIYLSPTFRAAYGFKKQRIWLAIDFKDGHVELFNSELDRATRLGQINPQTFAGLRAIIFGSDNTQSEVASH